MSASLTIIGAVVGTIAVAWWAVLIGASPVPIDTVRSALIVGGIISTCSAVAVPIDASARTVVPGVVLVAYQLLLAHAFALMPVATQAIVNTNVVLLIAWYAFAERQVPSPAVLCACCALLATTANVALVVRTGPK